MAAGVADGAQHTVLPIFEPVRLLDVAHRQAPAAPDRVEPSRQVRGQPRDVFAAVHAGRLEQQDVLEPAIHQAAPQASVLGAVGQRAHLSHGERQRREELAIERRVGLAEHHEVHELVVHATTHHLEQGLGELVARARVVQDHRDPMPFPALRQQSGDIRRQHFAGVVAARPAVLVMADAHEPRVLQRIEPAERHVSLPLLRGAALRGALGVPSLPRGGIVDEVMGHQRRRRRRQTPLLLEVEDGALDDVDRAAAGNLRVSLDVRDQQLDRARVPGQRGAETVRQVGGEQAGVLRPRRIDDEVRLGHSLRESRVEQRMQTLRLEPCGGAIRSQRSHRSARCRHRGDLCAGRYRESGSGGSHRRCRPRARGRWPSRSRATRCALVPSVTFSIRPPGKPTSAA